jgi:hypothetical protein
VPVRPRAQEERKIAAEREHLHDHRREQRGDGDREDLHDPARDERLAPRSRGGEREPQRHADEQGFAEQFEIRVVGDDQEQGRTEERDDHDDGERAAAGK